MTFNSYSLAGPDPRPVTVEEVRCLKKLVQVNTTENPTIVNIGAYIGVSTLAMLEERPGATIYSVDIEPCLDEMKNATRAGLDASRIIRMLGRSQDIGKEWNKPIDFMWIDGDHNYEAVMEDILTWAPWVVDGGVVAVHDCFDDEPPPHNPSGAGRAVRELMDSKDMIMKCDRIRAFKRTAYPGQEWARDMLFDMASETTVGCIVELGAFHGRGSIILARGARAGSGATVYTVDDYTQKTGWYGEFYGPLDKDIFRANIRKADVVVTLIQNTFHKAAQQWTEPIGLLFWDAGVTNRFWTDWLDWSKHIVQGGYFVVKDTERGALGTWPHIEDVLEAGEFVRDSIRDGIIVLRKK